MSYWKSWSHVNTPKTVRMAASLINCQKWPIFGVIILNFSASRFFPGISRRRPGQGTQMSYICGFSAIRNWQFWKICKKSAKKAKIGQISDILGYCQNTGGDPPNLNSLCYPHYEALQRSASDPNPPHRRLSGIEWRRLCSGQDFRYRPAVAGVDSLTKSH